MNDKSESNGIIETGAEAYEGKAGDEGEKAENETNKDIVKKTNPEDLIEREVYSSNMEIFYEAVKE